MSHFVFFDGSDLPLEAETYHQGSVMRSKWVFFSCRPIREEKKKKQKDGEADGEEETTKITGSSAAVPAASQGSKGGAGGAVSQQPPKRGQKVREKHTEVS